MSAKNKLQHTTNRTKANSTSHALVKCKVHLVPVAEILYADDDANAMADSLDGLQIYLSSLDESCRKFGLVISA